MARQQMAETNVLVPQSAFDALERFRSANGLSRDEAIRLLLRDHLDEQLSLDDDYRVTHISTVIRHPAPPANRTETSTAHRLRLRLPPGTADEARSVGLILPGQAAGRAYHDYQPRLLADAVATAIAKVEPFADDVLQGLLPLIRHRTAHSLWRLTVEGTRTRVERHTLTLTDDRGSRIALRLGEDEDEVAWRGLWRDEVMRHLVQRLLSGDEAQATEDKLFRRSGLWWDDLVVEARYPADDTNEVISGWPHAMRDWEGRGGAAVWRASRTVDLEDLRAWLTTPAGRTHAIHTPGWTVRMPHSWRTLPVPAGRDLDDWADRVARGEVLQVDHGSRTAIWPVLADRTPVPGFATVLDAAPGLAPDELAELVLTRWDEDTDLMLGPIDIAPFRAWNFGLISSSARDEAIAEARERTGENMQAVVDSHPELAPEVRRRLEDALTNPSHFVRLARQAGLSAGRVTVKPRWQWHYGSIADVLVSDAPREALEWLTREVAWRRRRALEASMEDAWKKAFHQAHQGWMGAV